MNRRAFLLSAAALPWAGGALAAEPTIALADARADFQALYTGLQQAHYDLYAFTPKARLDAAHAEALRQIDRPMTRFELQRHMQRFAALARMGHTRVDYLLPAWADYRKAGGKGFPLNLRIVEGRAYVAQNRSGVAGIAPGDEILTLNGAPMAQWLKRAGRNVSAETDYMSWSLLEYDFAPLLWAELGSVEAFDLQLRGKGGAKRVRLPALAAADLKPAAGRPFDAMTREARVLPGRIGYLRPGPFFNVDAKIDAESWDAAAFGAFIDKAFADFQAAGVDRILIDLRGNPGGDNSFSDRMIAWFATRPFRFFSQFRVKASPQAVAANRARIAADPAAAGAASQMYAELYARTPVGGIANFELPLTPPRKPGFGGKVWLLVDRQSYSNTVNVAALVQDYGFGTILGEETADLATAYGAMERFTLPKTGIAVGFPKALIVRPSGDRRPRGVTPDIAIPAPIVETSADEMLQAALAVVRSGRTVRRSPRASPPPPARPSPATGRR